MQQEIGVCVYGSIYVITVKKEISFEKRMQMAIKLLVL